MPRGLQVRVFHHRARRQDAGHVAADDLVLARSLDLVADDNLVTRMKQLAYVCLPRVVRDAAHRRPACLAQRPRRELHAHDRRRELGVIEKNLVEVAEPEEEDPVGVFLFGVPVLPHHRRDC